MQLKYAREIAEQLVFVLSPACERLEICGSVRRANKEDVKDIELVALPKALPLETAQVVFGQKPGKYRNLLEMYLAELIRAKVVKDHYPNIREKNELEMVMERGEKDGEKFKTFVVKTIYGEIKLDLFIATPPAQFGVIQIIRTGSAEFSRRLVTHKPYGLCPTHLKFKDGALWIDDVDIIETPDERDVFSELGWPFIAPSERR